MDPSRLSVSVNGFEPSADGRTFVYKVDVRYGAFEWSLYHRFSEFYALHNELFTEGYALLPSLPPKTIVRPNQPEVAKERSLKLNTFLLKLLVRADLRVSRPVVNWLQFEDFVGVSVPDIKLRPQLDTAEDRRFAVTDFAFLPGKNWLIVSQADLTPLSKLGKAWSVIEPEQVGSFHLYQFGCGTQELLLSPRAAGSPKSSAPAILTRIGGRGLSQRVCSCEVHTLADPQLSPHLLFGTESGELWVVVMDGAGESTSPRLRLERLLEVHIKAPFVKVQKFGDILASIGEDAAIRVLAPPAVPTADYELLSGGRVSRPLERGESLRCFYVDCDSKRVFLGTSLGKLLIYSAAAHPPQWLATIDVCAGCQVNLATTIGPSATIFDLPESLLMPEPLPPKRAPITCVCVSPDRRCLLAAVAGEVVQLDFQALLSTSDPAITVSDVKIGSISVNSEVTSMCCANIQDQITHDRPTADPMTYLFAALDRVIGVWRLDDCRLLQAIDNYNWGRIRKVDVLDVPTHFSLIDPAIPVKVAPHLVVATGSRGVQLLPLEDLSHWLSWQAGEEQLATLASSTKAGSTEPPESLEALKFVNESETETEKDLIILEAFGSAVF